MLIFGIPGILIVRLRQLKLQENSKLHRCLQISNRLRIFAIIDTSRHGVYRRANRASRYPCSALFSTHNRDWLDAACFSRIDIAMQANSRSRLAIVHSTRTGPLQRLRCRYRSVIRRREMPRGDEPLEDIASEVLFANGRVEIRNLVVDPGEASVRDPAFTGLRDDGRGTRAP